MDITLESHRDYMRKMFATMTVEQTRRHPDFVGALYATEAFLVEKVLNEKKPAIAGKTSFELPLNREAIRIIAPSVGAVNA